MNDGLEHHEQSAPVDEETARVTSFVRGRDAACPNCRYNVRDLQVRRCPECGVRLKLVNARDVPDQPDAAWVLAIMPGFVATILLVFVLLSLTGMGKVEVLFHPFSLLVMMSAASMVVILAKRRRFLMCSPRGQWLVAIGVWVAHAVGIVVVGYITVMLIR